MLLPHAASWIPGNASPICLSGQAETLAFGTELPVTQSRTALLLSGVPSPPARCLPLPSHSSPAQPRRPCWIIQLLCFYPDSNSVTPQSTPPWTHSGTSPGLPGRLHSCSSGTIWCCPAPPAPGLLTRHRASELLKRFLIH